MKTERSTKLRFSKKYPVVFRLLASRQELFLRKTFFGSKTTAPHNSLF